MAIAIVAGLLAGVMAVGGYFDRTAMNWREPDRIAAPRQTDLAVVYWSGDMGTRVGLSQALLPALAAKGIPVLSVTSPALFAAPRDRTFAESHVVQSIRLAMARHGVKRIAVIGDSFGADVLGAGLGQLPPALRKRITSVVLLVPATSVYFAENPLGIFYRGPVDSDPNRTLPLLHGLPVTCIYGTDEADSLCRERVMRGARRVSINDGHMMLTRTGNAVRAVVDGVTNPPAVFR